MSEPRDEIAEILAAHADFGRVAEPRNNADRNLGRTRYEMRCDCGARLPWEPSGVAHREHLATVLAEREQALIVAATSVMLSGGPVDGLEELWRDVAAKGITNGVDYPRIVLTLLSRLAAARVDLAEVEHMHSDAERRVDALREGGRG